MDRHKASALVKSAIPFRVNCLKWNENGTLCGRGDSLVDVHIDQLSAPQNSDLQLDNGLRIILSRASDPEVCSFWIGLYKSRGQGTSKEFLKIERLDEAFKYLSEVGLADDQPLMHSDNTGDFHRQFFLLPQSRFAAKSLILKTLESLGQKKTGLYLAPNLLNRPDSHEILGELVEGLAKLKTDEVYLLTSDIGVNQLLNISLKVKELLRNRRDVWIFH